MLAAKGIKATVTATPYTDEKLYKVTAMSFSITVPPVRVGEIHLEGVSAELQAKVKHVADRIVKTAYDTEQTAEASKAHLLRSTSMKAMLPSRFMPSVQVIRCRQRDIDVPLT